MQPASEIEPILTALEFPLNALIENIRSSLLPRSNPTQLSQQIDPSMAQPLMDSLAVMLSVGDVNAVNVIEENLEIMAAKLGQRFDDFRRSIDNFDFDHAAKILRDISATQYVHS